MKFYSILLIVLLALTNITASAQEANTAKIDNSISGQFNDLLEKSSNYQQYKVVPKNKIIQLKQNVLDSLSQQKKTISDKIQLIASEDKEIQQLKQKVDALQQEYDTYKDQKESIGFLWISMHKTTYSLLMWFLVLLFIGLSVWFYLQFTQSNVTTKASVENLKELEKEYEEHRRNALEREQKVRRQLQDEINKNRGVQ